MYQYIFFDLDGTLTDSKDGVLECVRYAIETLGRALPDDGDLLKFIGPPLQESFREYCGFSREESQRALRLFQERYVSEGQFKNRPAPGIAEMMGRLKERGYVLALASSKAESQCVPICRRFGFAPYLTVIAGSSGGRDQSKEEVIREAMGRLGLADPARALMVGDRRYDVEGARACGMDCVGVEFFGYAPPGELEEAGAVSVVRTVAELEAFILRHGAAQAFAGT